MHGHILNKGVLRRQYSFEKLYTLTKDSYEIHTFEYRNTYMWFHHALNYYKLSNITRTRMQNITRKRMHVKILFMKPYIHYVMYKLIPKPLQKWTMVIKLLLETIDIPAAFPEEINPQE